MLVTIKKSEFEVKVLEACEAPLLEKGFKIIDIDSRPVGKPLLRLFVDIPGKTGGPTVDDCAEVVRILDPILEAEKFFQGTYEMEVSSPGLDRRLRLSSDFEAVVGTEVHLNLLQSEPGLGANVKGELVRVDLDRVTIAQGVKNRKEFTIPFANIKRANRVWQFGAGRV